MSTNSLNLCSVIRWVREEGRVCKGPSKCLKEREVRVTGRKGEKERKWSTLRHINVRAEASRGMERGELTIACLGENFTHFFSNGILKKKMK